jgi:alpha-beta hydrolase superfamily lysophospholipase
MQARRLCEVTNRKGLSAGGAPLFLLGESLGGSIALRLMERPAAREKVQGLVLLAPVIRVAGAVLPPRPVLFLMRLLAYFFPRWGYSANARGCLSCTSSERWGERRGMEGGEGDGEGGNI